MSIVGVGIDLVDLARVRAMVRRQGRRVYSRVLTPKEAAYCLAHADPIPPLAARLAAKEALYKALSGERLPGLGWRSAGVLPGARGEPRWEWKAPLDRWARRVKPRVHLSLTHSRTAAAAVVVIER